MTKRDYEAIAKAINDTTIMEYRNKLYLPSNTVSKTSLIEHFIAYAKKNNPRFDENKFKEACNG